MPGDIFHGRPRSIHVAARGTFLVAARATCSMAANEHFYVAAVTLRYPRDLGCHSPDRIVVLLSAPGEIEIHLAPARGPAPRWVVRREWPYRGLSVASSGAPSPTTVSCR